MPRSNFFEECSREFLEKVWLKKNHNCGRSSVLKFLLLWGPMLTKTKKIVKIKKSKSFKNGRNGLEIWRVATFPQDMVLIPLMVSEKTCFTDDGRTDGRKDARSTAIALLTQSSRAKNKQINK